MNKDMFLREKHEYAAIDYTKSIAALFVVAIHISPFQSTNDYVFFWFNQILFRLAVPFFFMVSGFFVGNKIENRTMIFQYIKRIVVLYTLYTIIYLPQIAYSYLKAGKSLAGFFAHLIYKFLFEGSYTQFWYFPALIVAICFLFLLKNFRISDDSILYISILFYCMEVVGKVYRSLLYSIPLSIGFFGCLEVCLPVVRDGLLKAFPFVTLGYYVYRNKRVIDKRKCIILFVLFFGLMNIEAFRSISLVGYDGQEFLFATWPAVLYIFLFVASISLGDKCSQRGKVFRNLSTLIFGVHLFVRFYMHVIFVKIFNWELSSFRYYILMIICTTIFSYIILRLSKYSYFSWLKWLY